jgi:hypothetical protein
MKILVVVHVERGFGEQLEDLAAQIVRYSEDEDFDRVINITSDECLTGLPPFDCIAERFDDNREWIWGFDKEYYVDEDPEKWVEGKNWIETSGHEYSEILDWMHELSKNDEYVLVGGCRSECLQDIIDIWEHLDLNTTVNEQLTY